MATIHMEQTQKETLGTIIVEQARTTTRTVDHAMEKDQLVYVTKIASTALVFSVFILSNRAEAFVWKLKITNLNSKEIKEYEYQAKEFFKIQTPDFKLTECVLNTDQQKDKDSNGSDVDVMLATLTCESPAGTSSIVEACVVQSNTLIRSGSRMDVSEKVVSKKGKTISPNPEYKFFLTCE